MFLLYLFYLCSIVIFVVCCDVSVTGHLAVYWTITIIIIIIIIIIINSVIGL